MKILISVDIEGIAELDPRAELLLGKPRDLGMMAGIDQDCGAVFLVGWHARADSVGVLAHTISGFAFARVLVGGNETGEAGLYGALAAEFAVPVALYSGDDAFVAEAAPLFPGGVGVAVKRAHANRVATSLSPAGACAAIEAGAAQAAARVGSLKLRPVTTPIPVRVDATSVALADLFAMLPLVRRTGALSVEFTSPTMRHAVRVLNSLSAISSNAVDGAAARQAVEGTMNARYRPCRILAIAPLLYVVFTGNVHGIPVCDQDTQVSVLPSSSAVAESGGGAAAFVFTTGIPGGQTTNLTLAISGTASNGVDYETLPTTVAIAPLATQATLVLTPKPDAVAEGSETVVVTIVASDDPCVTGGFPIPPRSRSSMEMPCPSTPSPPRSSSPSLRRPCRTVPRSTCAIPMSAC